MTSEPGLEPSAPLVSVILPVLNAARFVRQALASLAAQTYPHFEILAVDGGSVDDTAAIVRGAPRTRFLQQSGEGLADAWNTGLQAARGRYICFMDSDDLWAKDKLAQQVGYLEQNPTPEYVIGWVKLFLEPGCSLPATLRPDILQGSHIGQMPGTLMARHRLFDAIGSFESEWGVSADVEWFARLRAERVPGGVLPQVVLHRRIHEANLSQRTGPLQIQRELLLILKHKLDRQRRRAEHDGRRPHGS